MCIKNTIKSRDSHRFYVPFLVSFLLSPSCPVLQYPTTVSNFHPITLHTSRIHEKTLHSFNRTDFRFRSRALFHRRRETVHKQTPSSSGKLFQRKVRHVVKSAFLLQDFSLSSRLRRFWRFLYFRPSVTIRDIRQELSYLLWPNYRTLQWLDIWYAI